jgi:hypothetical protein
MNGPWAPVLIPIDVPRRSSRHTMQHMRDIVSGLTVAVYLHATHGNYLPIRATEEQRAMFAEGLVWTFGGEHRQSTDKNGYVRHIAHIPFS